MDRKKANAIFKGSLMIMTVLLWEGSGICKNLYPVWAADESARYGQYGTFDMGNSEAAGEIGARVLYNLHPDEGISSSLKIGLRVNREMDACLFTVADQPWLRWETVFGLVDVFLRDGKGIACVEHDGKTGNPCVFSKKYYGELMELSGDVGGKRVVVAHRGDVAVMKVEDGREMVDVDFSDGRR